MSKFHISFDLWKNITNIMVLLPFWYASFMRIFLVDKYGIVKLCLLIINFLELKVHLNKLEFLLYLSGLFLLTNDDVVSFICKIILFMNHHDSKTQAIIFWMKNKKIRISIRTTCGRNNNFGHSWHNKSSKWMLNKVIANVD